MEMEIKNVTLPLNVTELKRFVEKRDCFYIVDYKGSELRDGIFLNYISNLELPAEVAFCGCSFEEKEALFVAYLTGMNITTMDSLRLNIAQMLLQYREISTEGVFENLAFDQEERDRFIRKHIALLSRWESFIESTIVFAAYCVQEFDLFSEIKDQIEEVDDAHFVGRNVVGLFSIPSFMELFFTPGIRHPLKFFKPQFKEYMFKGKNLFEYYFCEENLLTNLFVAQVREEISFEELREVTPGP